MSKRKRKRILHKNVHILINAVAVVLIWRGLWAIMDMYLLPGHLLASSIVGITAGIVILLYKDFLIDELK